LFPYVFTSYRLTEHHTAGGMSRKGAEHRRLGDQYLLGETTIADAGESLLRARVRAAEALAAVQQIAVMCVADGMSEAEAARRAGIDRMTVRKALGK
jgi:DNA invertase Pin-like site-specific DNA recombinase